MQFFNEPRFSDQQAITYPNAVIAFKEAFRRLPLLVADKSSRFDQNRGVP